MRIPFNIKDPALKKTNEHEAKARRQKEQAWEADAFLRRELGERHAQFRALIDDVDLELFREASLSDGNN